LRLNNILLNDQWVTGVETNKKFPGS
jgi:hypothetical protein